MIGGARTRHACLASAEKELRERAFPAPAEWRATSLAWRLDADNPRTLALVQRARRAQLAEAAGTVGIAAAVVALVWMLGKCGPTLFPALFL